MQLVTNIESRSRVPECRTASVWLATITTTHSARSALKPGTEALNTKDFAKTVSSFYVKIA